MAVWIWVAIGIVLLVIEVISFGTPLVWLGVPAIAVGLYLSLWPGLSIEGQLIVLLVAAGALSFLPVMSMRRRARKQESSVNIGAQRLVGARATLESAIHDGRGSAKIGDSVWPVSGPDLPKGARVVVTAADGATLFVQPAE
jgi:membrane protein implicated in regulation of membrane protease activity